ncbi:molybdopterin-guanine dinucleotide biosynthesis protein B [Paenibacillus sp. BSR1-1]|uniref:molybdopterin-guanine dinucleotide biosynthesis protein B n=1 Tax=Paenibacillus sp. BSR1-1 TaxID=3020845 RepID=UPI0025B025F1|nr:molybdopterin-guanine dinucleotide biosynthesis protein B [Paenibacillus sp. BSR1-1]MDN3015098.1 molybdopterin-guanine dinucleotide biosynthesis protein B [Paenibacillus sp. BSR1-1]
MVKPVIFQIVGYQNSGKTTFIEGLIEGLKSKGLRSAVIKHHGHGGKPELVDNKDSTKYLSAGAAASIIEGDGRLLLQVEKWENSLKHQIELMSFFDPDVILIEGYKQKKYPKLLILRDLEDLSLLKSVTNIMAVVYWKECIRERIAGHINIPCFFINDEASITWTVNLLKKSVK